MHDEPCPHCNGSGVMICPGCENSTADNCARCDGAGVLDCVFCEHIEGEVVEDQGHVRVRDLSDFVGDFSSGEYTEEIEYEHHTGDGTGTTEITPIYIGTEHEEQEEEEDVTEIDGLEQAASMLSLLYERGYIEYDNEMAPDKERVEKVLEAAKSESNLW